MVLISRRQAYTHYVKAYSVGNVETRTLPSSRSFPWASTGAGSKMFIEFAIRSSIWDMWSIRMLLFLSSTQGTYNFFWVFESKQQQKLQRKLIREQMQDIKLFHPYVTIMFFKFGLLLVYPGSQTYQLLLWLSNTATCDYNVKGFLLYQSHDSEWNFKERCTRMLQNLREDFRSVDFIERLAANVSTQSLTWFEPGSFKNSLLNGLIYNQM